MKGKKKGLDVKKLVGLVTSSRSAGQIVGDSCQGKKEVCNMEALLFYMRGKSPHELENTTMNSVIWSI